MCLAMFHIVGGHDACVFNVEKAVFKLETPCFVPCTEAAKRMAEDATFEDNDHRKHQYLNDL